MGTATAAVRIRRAERDGVPTPESEMVPEPALDGGEVRIRPITVAEYHRMLDAAILHEREPVELLDGRLIAMPPEGPAHADVAAALVDCFVRTFGARATVRAGHPVELGRLSEPQPDVALVRRREERYLGGHPKPADVFVLVEVSVSSLAYDRSRKLSAFARAGIAEYWIVDLVNARVDVFTEPREAGYGVHRIATREDAIAPQAFPGDAIAVAAFLP